MKERSFAGMVAFIVWVTNGVLSLAWFVINSMSQEHTKAALNGLFGMGCLVLAAWHLHCYINRK